jgi:WD40 repeat protein
LALSSDGKLLVTGSHGRKAFLWEAATGKKLHDVSGIIIVTPFLDFSRYPTTVALTGDGKVAVTGSGEAIVWDTATGRKLHTLKDQIPSRSTVNSDGKYFVTQAGPAGETTLWETVSGKKLQTIPAEGIIAQSGDGKLVLTLGSMWDEAASKKLHALLQGFGLSRSFSAGVSDDISASGQPVLNHLALWDATSGKKLKTYPRHPARVAVTPIHALSADGKHLVTGPNDPIELKSRVKAALWDLASGKNPQLLGLHDQPHGVALSGDGKVVVTGSEDAAILWDAASGKILQTLKHTEYVSWMALTDDAKLVVTASGNLVTRWEAASGKKLQAFQAPTGRIRYMAVSSDGKRIVTVSKDNKAIMSQATTGKGPRTFPGQFVAMSADGKRVLTSFDKKAILWETANGTEVQNFEWQQPGWSGALSGDGKLVVTWSHDDGIMILWDAVSGRKLQTIHGGPYLNITAVVLRGDGKQLWTASGDGTTRLWDPATGKERCRLYCFTTYEKDWLVVTPEGLFDGSEGAWQFVTYREPDTLKLIDDDATRRRFHRPSLLAHVWKGEK